MAGLAPLAKRVAFGRTTSRQQGHDGLVSRRFGVRRPGCGRSCGTIREITLVRRTMPALNSSKIARQTISQL